MGISEGFDDRLPGRYVRAAEQILKRIMKRKRWSYSDRDALAQFLVEHFEMKRAKFELAQKQSNEVTRDNAS